MINRQELLDRFGDTEFLLLLWRKTEKEIPERLKEIDGRLKAPPPYDREALVASLHKLRGLLANFLTTGNSVSMLVQCENAVLVQNFEALLETWPAFRTTLDGEILELNRWLEANSTL